jgi:ubiquinone/menaquinone biosynthesis C-methylase UbiE
MHWTANVKQAYQDRRVAQDYDRERFSSFVGRMFDYLEKNAIKKALGQAQKQSKVSTVLDIPCGTGRITEVFLEQDLHVLGGDISQEMITVARSKLSRFHDRVSFNCLDLDQLDLPSFSYDLVSCIRLFHHLQTKQRAALLQKLARVSRKYVIINVSYSSPFYRQRRRLKEWLKQGVSPTNSTWAEIQRETHHAGLQVAASYFVWPFVTEDCVLLLEKTLDL